MPHQLSKEQFDAWFVGLVEGEGCLFASLWKNPAGQFQPQVLLSIRLRDDDTIIVKAIKERFGGRIYKEKGRKPTHNPSIRWVGDSRIVLMRLVRVFDAYPMIGKKRLQYPAWRELVLLKQSGITQPLVPRFRQLAAALKAGKKYEAPDVCIRDLGVDVEMSLFHKGELRR